MSNPPENKLFATALPVAVQSEEEARLQDYLEHLIAPLIGIVPYSERAALRQEVYEHLDGLICEYQYQGKGLQEATETALREMGEPWKVGNAFLHEWLQGTVHVPPVLLSRRATVTAFAWFGTASMMLLLLLDDALLVPSHEGVLLPVVGLLAFFAPIVAGGATGASAPFQAKRGIRNAVLVLALISLLTGLVLLPRVEGMIIAGWQLLFWLPAGRVSAATTALWRRQARRQRFWLFAK